MPQFSFVFLKFSTVSLARGFIETKTSFLRQFGASGANRHIKSVLTKMGTYNVDGACTLAKSAFSPISTFSVGEAFIVAKATFLSQFEVSSENRFFKSVLTKVNAFAKTAFWSQFVILSLFSLKSALSTKTALLHQYLVSSESVDFQSVLAQMGTL